MSRRIGLDVGGVIIDALANDGTDTDLRGDNFMKTTAVPGAYDAARYLVGKYGRDNVGIISKCGEIIERKTRLWLLGNDFYVYTGFDPANLRFCRTRAEKAPIAREMGLTDYVDDHADVLRYMQGIVDGRFLFGPQRDPLQNTSGLIVVKNWAEALTYM
ncbi:MAG TPA: hypothetical protein VJ841_05475 [Candidatus Saccharimonadales bacterium]|nr:hypothetical protein [Candidatus Saccharimonadales bacterium]